MGFFALVHWSRPVQSVPGAERAGDRTAEPQGPTGSSLSQRTAASLLLENKAGTRTKKETWQDPYSGFK